MKRWGWDSLCDVLRWAVVLQLSTATLTARLLGWLLTRRPR
jgi:hypothetical protein